MGRKVRFLFLFICLRESLLGHTHLSLFLDYAITFFLSYVEDVEKGNGKGYGGLEGENGKERETFFYFFYFSVKGEDSLRNLSFSQLLSHRFLDLSSIAFFFFTIKEKSR